MARLTGTKFCSRVPSCRLSARFDYSLLSDRHFASGSKLGRDRRQRFECCFRRRGVSLSHLAKHSDLIAVAADKSDEEERSMRRRKEMTQKVKKERE